MCRFFHHVFDILEFQNIFSVKQKNYFEKTVKKLGFPIDSNANLPPPPPPAGETVLCPPYKCNLLSIFCLFVVV